MFRVQSCCYHSYMCIKDVCFQQDMIKSAPQNFDICGKKESKTLQCATPNHLLFYTHLFQTEAHEGDCACGLMKGQKNAGVFFSMSLGHLHKVPACSPPNPSICPWNSCRTLPSPSLPPCQSVHVPGSLCPIRIWTYFRGGEDRFVCVITPALSVGFRQLPIDTCPAAQIELVIEDLDIHICAKGYSDKVLLRWLTPNSIEEKHACFFLGVQLTGGKKGPFKHPDPCAPFNYFVLSVDRFEKKKGLNCQNQYIFGV